MRSSRHGRNSPETRLLLTTCRHDGAIPDTTETIDWDVLLATATATRVSELVYRTLKRVPGSMPEPVRLALRRQYAETAATNLRQAHGLEGVLRALAERSIPAMLLKGAALVRMVYGDPGLRPMTDIDLLVPRDDIERAADAMLSCGLPPVLPGSEEIYRREHHHWVPCGTPDGSLVVELHHGLVPPGGPLEPVIEDVWRRAHPAPGTGARVLLPSPADLLLHLCIHTSSHGLFLPLRSVCDLAETVRWAGADLDWDGLVEAAREWHAAREAYCFLRLAEEFLAPGIPQYVLGRLNKLSHFATGQETLLLRMARKRALRTDGDRGGPVWLREKTWEWAIAPGGLGRKVAGMARILWKGLQDSAHAERPDLPPGRARWYAATCHPFVLLRRKLISSATRLTHGDHLVRTRN